MSGTGTLLLGAALWGLFINNQPTEMRHRNEIVNYNGTTVNQTRDIVDRVLESTHPRDYRKYDIKYHEYDMSSEGFNDGMPIYGLDHYSREGVQPYTGYTQEQIEDLYYGAANNDLFALSELKKIGLHKRIPRIN